MYIHIIYTQCICAIYIYIICMYTYWHIEYMHLHFAGQDTSQSSLSSTPAAASSWVLGPKHWALPHRKWRSENDGTSGGFHNWGYPKMDGLLGKIPLKWMIWGYPNLWKPSYGRKNPRLGIYLDIWYIPKIMVIFMGTLLENDEATDSWLAFSTTGFRTWVLDCWVLQNPRLRRWELGCRARTSGCNTLRDSLRFRSLRHVASVIGTRKAWTLKWGTLSWIEPC